MPLPKEIKLSNKDRDILQDPWPYRRLGGSLLYLGFTRPNLAFATKQLSQYVQNPRTTHWSNWLLCLPWVNYGFLEDEEANTMSKSSAEAEYRAMATIVCELLWLSYVLQDWFKQGFISPQHVSSLDQLEDFFTKNLSAPSFHNLIFKLDMIDCYQAST